MKNFTDAWIKKHSPCLDAVGWLKEQPTRDVKKTITALMKIDRFDWANWAISRSLSKLDKIRYAVFAVEQVLALYEKRYPNDDRPKKAIKAAKAVLKNNTAKTRAAASAAAYAAASAAWAAWTADAAYAAADAAYAAARAAYAAAYAAYAAAYAAARAADAVGVEMKKKIINYGLNLLLKEKT